MRSISIMWTRYTDFFGELVYYLTGRTYTHASISLDEDQECYYSFCYKGFCRESIEKYRRRGVKKSFRMRLDVPDDVYEGLWMKLRFVEKNTRFYEYSMLGVICALLHIPLRWHGHYFCSQFVAELLESAGAVRFSRPACITLPSQLLQELQRAPGLAETAAGVV